MPEPDPILDATSLRLIELLQGDGRLSYRALADEVGLSEAAVRQRVQRLLAAGTMQIVAVTDPLEVGLHRQAMVGIRVTGAISEAADQLAQLPEVAYVVITAGSFDLLVEVVCADDASLLELLDTKIRAIPTVVATETLTYLKLVKQSYAWGAQPRGADRKEGAVTDLTDPQSAPASTAGQKARDHLWMHFTRMSSYHEADVPIIVKGEREWVWDDHGHKLLDGLSGLFVVQAGHGREQLAQAAYEQSKELAYFPLWSYAHPQAAHLAERLASHAPGDLNRIFFTTGGSEAVEAAWKMARQYFRATGKPGKHKAISRQLAYHGTSFGALSITGLEAIKEPFGPLVPSTRHVPNTNFYRAPEHGDDAEAFGRWAADQIEEAILAEGADTVAAVFLEPVQNSGGCFPPPPGYFQRVREICDRHDVLLVSDEVICAFGRLGHIFACNRYDYVPDIITCAKGITSGYIPLGAAVVSDRLMEPFLDGHETFLHGITFGGHPVATAVANANLDLFEEEHLLDNVLDRERSFRASLETLSDLPIVGDVRGDGFFYGIEMVKDKATKETFDDDESERLIRGFLSGSLYEAGLHCRADDRGDPVIQLAPPLTCTQEHFDLIVGVLRQVLTDAWDRL